MKDKEYNADSQTEAHSSTNQDSLSDIYEALTDADYKFLAKCDRMGYFI